MKKITVLLVSMLFTLLSFSQTQTIFNNIHSFGLFGAPIIEVGSIDGQIGASVGGGGALIMDNFFIGGYGMNSDYANVKIDEEFYDIDFQHGGLWLGYTSDTRKLLHVYSSLRVGWGSTEIKSRTENDNNFVMTPELGLEINIFKFLRLGFTGGYRWINGIDSLPELDNESFSSPIGSLTIRIGGFGNSGYHHDRQWED